MTLVDMELAVRQDLNDLDSTQYRWPTTVLDRCIGRAVREYSFVWPRIQGLVMPCLTGVRAYPLPVASSLVAPAAPVLSLAAGSGWLPAGELFARVAAATLNGESAPSPEVALTLLMGDAAVLVNVPAVPGASRYNIYAGAAAGGEYWNGQCTAAGAGAYTISSLAPAANSQPGQPSPASSNLPLLLSEPAASIDGWWVESVEFPVGLWPPRFVPFEEQGGLFVLNVDVERVPGAEPGTVMNVLYAGSQQLDAAGSSLPDQDWDVVALGAYGYACLQYGLPTADNFDFQDGELRDKVDDSMVPRMWRQFGQDALTTFRARLEEIRHRRDFAAAAVAQWGDVPRRWARL
ncbi:MAG: hypothetical protein ACRDHX_15160 [Chloroflexota bacterium]